MNREFSSYEDLIDDSSDQDPISSTPDTKDIIDKYNQQYIKNEEQKRQQRTTVLAVITRLVVIQMIFFNLVVVLLLATVVLDLPYLKSMSIETVTALLDFLKYYISATIVELLGMLLFIVRNLFNSKGISKFSSKN